MTKQGSAIACAIRIFDVFEAVLLISKTAKFYPGFARKIVSFNLRLGRWAIGVDAQGDSRSLRRF